MRNTRKLSLKRESLTQLSTGEMSSVVGGSHFCGVTDYCTDDLTHRFCPSLEVCPTIPVTQCVALVDTVAGLCY